MSVHNHPADFAAHPGYGDSTAAPARWAAVDPSRPPEFPRHVVTAVLVAHDGARWLPEALAGLAAQERPVQNAVAADTGSADDSARLLGETLGDPCVLHLARRSGFGAAVDEASRIAAPLGPEELPYLKRPSGWDPVSRTWRDETYDLPELPHGEPVQWLWLLHDDCAPTPTALAELLRAVENEAELGNDVAIVGPKLRGWYDRRQLLEVGVSIAPSGRRWTGIDRREQDQGQHDSVRPVLSVSTAGMLIRRDVYEELGGLDRGLPLMRDDVDLCWRANAAGHRVLVAPGAVVRHAEAASRERRTVDCVGRTASSPHRVDKAGAVRTLLVNTRTAALPWTAFRILLGTVLRTLAYLVGKTPGQAVDEITGLLSVLLRPGRLLKARRARGQSAVEPAELRPLFPPPGATLRLTVEQIAGSLAGRTAQEESSGGRHGVVESGPGGDDADYMEVEQFARIKRLSRKPGPVLFAVLLLFSLIACRNLLGTGSLMGGALLPAPDRAGELWSSYTDAWHALGTGSTEAAPPYLALVASLATLFLGSTSAAMTVLLVCSVPLAGVTAYFATRPLVESRLLRAWAAIAYAFLPAATGALADGRIGTALLAVLLPLMARAALSAAGFLGRRGTWRAAWALALLLTLTTAFTPVVWLFALVLGALVLAVRRSELPAYGPRLLAVLLTPLLLLAPWSFTLFSHGLLGEAGLDDRAGSASATDLLGMNPGGPGTMTGLLLIGIVLAALGALLRGERRTAVLTAWSVALVGFALAVLTNRDGWAGPATLVQGAALLGAALIGAQGARFRVAEQSFGWRQPLAALVGIAAALGPLVAALGWMAAGADGPLERRSPTQVPAFVAADSGTQDRARTLVLDGDNASEVRYFLIRGAGNHLGDAEQFTAAGPNARLGETVGRLVAGSGADQAGQLGSYAIRYILLREGRSSSAMGRVLDATPGLMRVSRQDGLALWRVDREVARVTLTDKQHPPKPVAAGPVDVHTRVPAGAEGRVLRLADSADPGWTASLDGKPLSRTTVDGWAQGFTLPASGGHLDVTYDQPFTRTLWVGAQGLLGLVLVVLALPGRRRDIDDDLPEEEIAVPAQAVDGEGRRARRLRAAAEAEGQEERGAAPDPAAVPAYASTAEYDPYGYGSGGGYDTYANGTGYDGGGYGTEGAAPYDPDTGRIPPYDPNGPDTGQVPPYDPNGPDTGQVPPYDPNGPETGQVPPYDPNGPDTGQVPPYDPNGPATGQLPPYQDQGYGYPPARDGEGYGQDGDGYGQDGGYDTPYPPRSPYQQQPYEDENGPYGQQRGRDGREHGSDQ
ncbi:glycosyltransferase [Streptomyces sp. GZWMJZ-114]|uniref:glycosyltransferase n=1 Tax=Streptomyces sp. GZWMJZ-114 TaxID=2494734 RepID=UPI001012154E|nr:glycosyltransferase [Streptomyces sp. GZWMJZ-114]